MRLKRLGMSMAMVATLAAGVSGQGARAPVAKGPATKKAPAGPAAPRPSPAPAVLTNADVEKLARAGFTDELIVARVAAGGPHRFDLGADALVVLKAAGVSERVIAVMLGGGDPGPAQATASQVPRSAAQGTRESPLALTAVPPLTTTPDGTDAGIYVLDGDQRTLLEPTVFSGGKTGGMFMASLTMGIKKAKWKAVVRSPRAVLRMPGRQPAFLFIFERQGSGLSHAETILGASSANEFVLARMAVNDHERELIVGEFGAFGASAGTRSEDTIQLEIARVQRGVYRVSPRSPLPPGEYCFYYAGGMSASQTNGQGKLFDFGVD